jgi:hypothetical protein
MYTNNNFAFSAVAKKVEKNIKKKRNVCQEGVSPYHKFTKLNNLTGDISHAIHVSYRINGTRGKHIEAARRNLYLIHAAGCKHKASAKK